MIRKYEIIPKGDDAYLLRRKRVRGDNFHGTQIVAPIGINKENVHVARMICGAINKIETLTGTRNCECFATND